MESADKINQTNQQQTKEDSFQVESALDRLEEITRALQDKTLPLEEAMKLYQEGTLLAKECQEHLEGVEKQLQILSGNTEEHES